MSPRDLFIMKSLPAVIDSDAHGLFQNVIPKCYRGLDSALVDWGNDMGVVLFQAPPCIYASHCI